MAKTFEDIDKSKASKAALDLKRWQAIKPKNLKKTGISEILRNIGKHKKEHDLIEIENELCKLEKKISDASKPLKKTHPNLFTALTKMEDDRKKLHEQIVKLIKKDRDSPKEGNDIPKSAAKTATAELTWWKKWKPASLKKTGLSEALKKAEAINAKAIAAKQKAAKSRSRKDYEIAIALYDKANDLWDKVDLAIYDAKKKVDKDTQPHLYLALDKYLYMAVSTQKSKAQGAAEDLRSYTNVRES